MSEVQKSFLCSGRSASARALRIHAAIRANALETLTAFMNVVAFYSRGAPCVTYATPRKHAKVHTYVCVLVNGFYGKKSGNIREHEISKYQKKAE